MVKKKSPNIIIFIDVCAFNHYKYEKINVIHYSLFEITQLQHYTALVTVNINMHFIHLFSCMNIITHITFTLYVFLSVCASIQWWYITCLIAPQKGIILWNHGKIGGCHLLVTGMLLVVVYTIYVMNFLMAMHNATSYATCIESVNIMATDLIMLHNVVYNHGNFSEFILDYHGSFVWHDLIKASLWKS